MNKKVYFTSDWHINHAKSIEFDKRPFRDLDHMHRVLINNYNSTVGKHDICYFLGDIGFTKGTKIQEIISQLNGTKILIQGNHDKKGMQYWTSCGFSAILNSASIVIAKEVVTMSHCPLLGTFREDVEGMRGAIERENWHGEKRHSMYSLPNFGQFHLHGHIHSGPHRNDKKKILGKQFDVGVVGNKYKPVNRSQIESWIARYGKTYEQR